MKFEDTACPMAYRNINIAYSEIEEETQGPSC